MATGYVDVAVRVKGAAQLEALEKAFKSLDATSSKISGKIEKVNVSFKGTGKAAKASVGGVRAFGAAVQSALGPILALTSAAALAASAFDVLQRQDFAEAKFETLGGNADDLVANLKEVSDELNGAASTVELTAAAYDVASAGFTSAAEASQVLKAAAQGAAGGFSDINTVGNAATSVLNAYGMAASDAGFLVDQFVQTQNDGKIVVDEYAQNIGKVASAAAGLGIPLSEVNAVIAQATASGVQAEVAFTGLKGALARLASGEASKALKDVGIDISAATLEADGLLGTLQKLEGLDTGQVFKALGTEAGPALLPILNNLERFEELIENQEGAVGTAAKAQARAANTIQGAIKRVTTAWENFVTEGSAGSQLIIGALDLVAVSIQALGDFTQGLVTIYKQVEQAVVFTLQVIQNVWNGFYNFFVTLVNNTLTAWNKLLFSITGNTDDASVDIQNSFGGIADFFDQLTVNIQKAWNGMLKQMIAGIVNFTTAFNNSPLQKMAELAGVDLGAFVAPALVGEVTSASSRPETRRAGPTALDVGQNSAALTGTTVGGADMQGGGGPRSSAQKKRLEDFVGSTDNVRAQIAEKTLQVEQQIADALALGNDELAKELALKKSLIPLNEEIAALEAYINDIKTNPKIKENFSQDEISKALTEAEEQLSVRLTELETKGLQQKNTEAQKGLDIAKADLQAKNDALRSLDDQKALLEAKLNGNEKEVRLMMEARDIAEDIKGLSKETVLGRLEELDALEQQVEAAEQLKEQTEQVASDIAGEFTGALGDIIKGTKGVEEAFSDMLTNIGNMFIDFAMKLLQDQITQQLIGLFGNLLGGLGGGGGGMNMGSVTSGLGAISFSGGGSTGNGPRSGGLDGEGGFMAMLHPQETVIDHTKRNAMSDYGSAGSYGHVSSAPIKIDMTTTTIAGVEYMTVEQGRAMAQKAADEGAKRGSAGALGKMRNSPATRSRLKI